MKRNANLGEQWARLMDKREQVITALVRIEAKAAKLRRAMARRTNKKAKGMKVDQSPLPGLVGMVLDDELDDMFFGA